MEPESAYRELNLIEKKLLGRLLETHFLGRDQIEEQIRVCKVRALDDDGCLEFAVPSGTGTAMVTHRVPVEAEADDSGGNRVHMLLHVVNGIIDELEFFTESGNPIIGLPPPEKWDVIILAPPPVQ